MIIVGAAVVVVAYVLAIAWMRLLVSLLIDVCLQELKDADRMESHHD